MLALALGFALAAPDAPYPTVDVTMCDNPYCIGYRTGAQMQQTIVERLDTSKGLAVLREFYETDEGKAAVEAMALYNAERYPKQHSELAGLADGSGAKYRDILLINLRSELSLYVRNTTWWQRRVARGAPSGALAAPALVEDCSDYVLRSASGDCAITHNEDNEPATLNHSYWVTARVDDSPGGEAGGAAATWTAFTYAGEMPTGAFAVSERGYGFSTNAEFPRDIKIQGVARTYLLRHLLDSSGADAALDILVKAAANLSACRRALLRAACLGEVD